MPSEPSFDPHASSSVADAYIILLPLPSGKREIIRDREKEKMEMLDWPQCTESPIRKQTTTRPSDP
uniref:Uncharacterized protein n=1 Tax=Oryza rufipogon TaxID=4529 RepID=A0A0E0PAK4_ORYRU